MAVRFVTLGGIPGKFNVYFENWTCKINATMDVSGYEIVDFETVNAVYTAEHPEEEEAAE
ncbi:MAG: hypothetical protein WC181_08395 [Defluviitoga sp.]